MPGKHLERKSTIHLGPTGSTIFILPYESGIVEYHFNKNYMYVCMLCTSLYVHILRILINFSDKKEEQSSTNPNIEDLTNWFYSKCDDQRNKKDEMYGYNMA